MKATSRLSHDPRSKYLVEPMGSNFLFPDPDEFPKRGAFSPLLLLGMVVDQIVLLQFLASAVDKGDQYGKYSTITGKGSR